MTKEEIVDKFINKKQNYSEEGLTRADALYLIDLTNKSLLEENEGLRKQYHLDLLEYGILKGDIEELQSQLSDKDKEIEALKIKADKLDEINNQTI